MIPWKVVMHVLTTRKQEGGLLGSQAVAKDYSEFGVDVYAQLQVSQLFSRNERELNARLSSST